MSREERGPYIAQSGPTPTGQTPGSSGGRWGVLSQRKMGWRERQRDQHQMQIINPKNLASSSFPQGCHWYLHAAAAQDQVRQTHSYCHRCCPQLIFSKAIGKDPCC